MNGSMTGTLTEFLLARIAEDESWAAENPHFTEAPDYVPPWWTRVLAECEAKRRIVGLHEPVRVDDGPAVCAECASDGFAPCDTLRNLTAVYADHPDYRNEWRP